MHMHEDWPARFAGAGFAVESERRFVIALQPPPDSPLAAAVTRYAMVTFCRARHGLQDKLSAGDIAGARCPAPALSARDDLTVRTSRTVRLARKPADNRAGRTTADNVVPGEAPRPVDDSYSPMTRPLLVLVLDLSNRCGRVEEVRLSDELAGRQRGCLRSEEPAIQAGDPHDLDQSRAG